MGARRVGSNYTEDAGATTTRTLNRPFVAPGSWVVIFASGNNNPPGTITVFPNGFSQFGSRVQDGSNTVLDVLVRYIPDQVTADAVNNSTGADATWTLTHDVATKGQYATYAYTGLLAAAMFVGAVGAAETGTGVTAHTVGPVTVSAKARMLTVFADRLTAGVVYTYSGPDAVLLNKQGAPLTSNAMNMCVLESDIVNPGSYSRTVSLNNVSDAAVEWIAQLNVDTTSGYAKSDTGRTPSTSYMGDGASGLTAWPLAVPEELMIGDLIHAYFVCNNASGSADTITPPDGSWTANVVSSITGQNGYAWYRHTVTKAEVEQQKLGTGPTWTFSTSAARTGNWITERIRDYDRSSPYDGAVVTGVGGTQNTSITGPTTTGNRRLLTGFGLVQSASGQTIIPPKFGGAADFFTPVQNWDNESVSAVDGVLPLTTDTPSNGDTAPAAFVENTGNGGSMRYSVDTAARGTPPSPKSLKFSCGATATSQYVEWNTTGSGLSLYGRVYLRIPSTAALPGALDFYQTRDASTRTRLRLNTGRTISLVNGSTVTATSTAALQLDRWYRIETKLIISAASGIIEAKIYLGDENTAIETVTSTALNTGTTECTNVRIGNPLSLASSGPFYMDELGVGYTGYLGPGGMTVIRSTCTLNLGRGQVVANREQFSAAASGTLTWFKSSSLSGAVGIVAVKPELAFVPGVLSGPPPKLKYWNGSAWVVVNKLKWNSGGGVFKTVKAKGYV